MMFWSHSKQFAEAIRFLKSFEGRFVRRPAVFDHLTETEKFAVSRDCSRENACENLKFEYNPSIAL